MVLYQSEAKAPLIHEEEFWASRPPEALWAPIEKSLYDRNRYYTVLEAYKEQPSDTPLTGSPHPLQGSQRETILWPAALPEGVLIGDDYDGI